MLKDFFAFLKEFNIVSLAVGFVMGSASTALVNSLVKDIFMPILAPLMGSGAWKDATWTIGPIHIAIGSFAAELFNFLLLAFFIFIIVRKLFKESKK